MSVYRRGKTWWYSFVFGGQYIQESAKTQSKTVAKEAEKARRRELEDGYNKITREDRKRRILPLAKAAAEFEENYKARHAENASSYTSCRMQHLVERLLGKMLIEIDEKAVKALRAATILCFPGEGGDSTPPNRQRVSRRPGNRFGAGRGYRSGFTI